MKSPANYSLIIYMYIHLNVRKQMVNREWNYSYKIEILETISRYEQRLIKKIENIYIYIYIYIYLRGFGIK